MAIQARPPRPWLPLLLGVALVCLCGCAPSHILHHQAGVSRSWTTIAFGANRQPFVQRSRVGGEQINTIFVLAFEGDRFTVRIRATPDPNVMTISGEGICARLVAQAPLAETWSVAVHHPTVLFAIALSAHPYADYELTLSKR